MSEPTASSWHDSSRAVTVKTASTSIRRSGYWFAALSIGDSPDGKRRRRTVRSRTKTDVRDKLRALREDIASNVQPPAAYTVRQAIEDWLESGLDGRSKDTVTKYRYVFKPVSERIGHATLRELTANDVRKVLTGLAGSGRLTSSLAM
jgi:hypothetical protein